MANVRKFDRDEALDQILQVFWTKGFEGTSLDDLVAATGVKKQSLYNTFGNKDAMFDAALGKYLDDVGETLYSALITDVPLPQALRNFLEGFTKVVTRSDTPAGCFVTNSAVEFGLRDGSGTHDRLMKHFSGLEEDLAEFIESAEDQPAMPARSAARQLISAVIAIAVLFRLNRDRDHSQAMIDSTLHILFPARNH